MQYVDFGRTGLRVSRLGFGGIPVQRIDEPGTRAMLKAAHEAGINYIDTARAYTVSEEWIGQALEELGLRDEFILATKCRALTKAEMEAELGEGNKKPEVLAKLAQYELTLKDWVEAVSYTHLTLPTT